MVCGACDRCQTFYRWGAVGTLDRAYCPTCGDRLDPLAVSADYPHREYILYSEFAVVERLKGGGRGEEEKVTT
jgi:hypothetical protein